MRAGSCGKPGWRLKADAFDPAALTQDALFGGAVRLAQPRDGYRAGVDPILLAASVPVSPGQSVLELGCGAAPALCALAFRVPGLALYGLELQPAYADLARRNLAQNGHEGVIWVGDIAAPPSEMRALRFDHVMLNPPYYRIGHRAPTSRADREIGIASQVPLAAWITCASRRLKPRGTLTVIQRADRLPELLTAMDACVGSIQLWPLVPRAGRDPRLILLRGIKEGRGDFRCHAGLVMHRGDTHWTDGDDYTPRVHAALREGAALPFPH